MFPACVPRNPDPNTCADGDLHVLGCWCAKGDARGATPYLYFERELWTEGGTAHSLVLNKGLEGLRCWTVDACAVNFLRSY